MNTNRNNSSRYTIGIDIGGTKCAVVLGKGSIPETYDPEFILKRVCFQTSEYNGWKRTLGRITEEIDRVLEENKISVGDLVGIGISCGGPLDYRNGIILSPPNLIGWNDVPIVRLLAEQYPVPVYLQNDANACALAEWRFGAARGMNNVIFLTFGTGFGAGLILDGRLYHGTNDMAGEIGHVRMADHGPVGYGKAGSMEGFCSGGGIAQIAATQIMQQQQRGITPDLLQYADDQGQLTAKQIGLAASGGDELAREIFKISADYLGRGLAVLIDILNPEVVVIGSIYERCEEYMREQVLHVLRQEALSYSLGACKVVPAGLQDQIGDYAALSAAFGH